MSILNYQHLTAFTTCKSKIFAASVMDPNATKRHETNGPLLRINGFSTHLITNRRDSASSVSTFAEETKTACQFTPVKPKVTSTKPLTHTDPVSTTRRTRRPQPVWFRQLMNLADNYITRTYIYYPWSPSSKRSITPHSYVFHVFTTPNLTKDAVSCSSV